MEIIKTEKSSDVIGAIQTAKNLASINEYSIGTVHVNYCGRPLTVVYNLHLPNAVQIAGPKPLNVIIYDWSDFKTSGRPAVVTKEFLGRE